MSGRFHLGCVVLCMQTLAAHGFNPCRRDRLPPKVREHYRSVVCGVYRGERKGYNAWRRFERACAEAARFRSPGAS